MARCMVAKLCGQLADLSAVSSISADLACHLQSRLLFFFEFSMSFLYYDQEHTTSDTFQRHSFFKKMHSVVCLLDTPGVMR